MIYDTFYYYISVLKRSKRERKANALNIIALSGLRSILKGIMKYQGVIIEESLRDGSALSGVTITSTKVEKVTPAHKTPWLQQWTLHHFEADEQEVEGLAQSLSRALQVGYWYADFKNSNVHYIVFPNEVFRIDRSKPEQYKAAVEHGLTLDIPEYQLDFSPAIKDWQRDNSLAS